jgi:hypothetical protein
VGIPLSLVGVSLLVHSVRKLKIETMNKIEES